MFENLLENYKRGCFNMNAYICIFNRFLKATVGILLSNEKSFSVSACQLK